MRLIISSLQNERIKQTLQLRERRNRDSKQLFLIEGFRELHCALQRGLSIQQLFICPELFLGENEAKVIEAVCQGGGEIIQCTAPVFAKLSYRDRPDGLLAIAPHLKNFLSHLATDKSDSLLIVAESIEKPGNLGTILRSADAAGVDGVIVCDRCTDIHNPNVVRASVGTLFTIPVIEATGESTLDWLLKNKVTVIATSPAATLEFTQVDLTGKVALAVGTEQYGLSQRWLDFCDCQSQNTYVWRS